MLNKVASGMLLVLLGSLYGATTVAGNVQKAAAPYKFSSVLSQDSQVLAQAQQLETDLTKIGFDSTGGFIYIDNDSPIGKYTLRAECDFGRAGKI